MVTMTMAAQGRRPVAGLEELDAADLALLRLLAEGYDVLEAYRLAGFEKTTGQRRLQRLVERKCLRTREQLLIWAGQAGVVRVER